MQALLTNPEYHDVLSIIKGFRNGAVYGAKIRFPHALVMTFLFKTGTLREKMSFILDATFQHSRNLAYFVTIYKSLMLSQRYLNSNKEHSAHAFIAGLVGGYYVFGKNNTVNSQIVYYLFSRIVIGLVKTATKNGYFSTVGMTYDRAMSDPRIFPVFASVIWGCVMWLFRYERDTLQPSLQASMQYLYNDSDKWTSMRNLLWHNI